MINLRYHIISITAVFLALGIGLALGAIFVDQATIDTLRQQLDALDRQKDGLQDRNAVLQEQLGRFNDLGDQAGDQLLAGRLADAPVVLIAVRGIDEDTVTATRDSLVAAGSRFAGTLWLTESLMLEGELERLDLGAILNIASDDVARLQASVARRLGDVLAEAGERAFDGPNEPDGGTLVEGVQETTTTVAFEGDEGGPGEQSAEPPLLAALRAAGFLEFEAPETPPAEFEVLPAAGAHYMVLSGEGAVVPDDMILVPMLRAIVDNGVLPIVAAQAVAESPADGESEPSRTGFVGPLRDDDELDGRISTVDDLELFAGQVAAILALEHMADGQVGHYGIGEGADSLVPPPVDD